MCLTLTNPSLCLRPITPRDEAVLCRIYGSTRTEELERVGHWTTAQKQVFLQGQFRAQHLYYGEHYPGAWFWLLVLDGQTIGRLYLQDQHTDGSVRIIDITLLPPWRSRGIGKQLLLDVMTFAAGLDRPITIHVESFNPAMRLYQRLGFEPVSVTNGVYHLLQWKPTVAVLD